MKYNKEKRHRNRYLSWAEVITAIITFAGIAITLTVKVNVIFSVDMIINCFTK